MGGIQVKRNYQLRFNPKKLYLNPPIRLCKLCGDKTGPSGICGVCKTIYSELSDNDIIEPKITQMKLNLEE